VFGKYDLPMLAGAAFSLAAAACVAPLMHGKRQTLYSG